VQCSVNRPPAKAHPGTERPAGRAGKSTLLRATCVAVVLAQMGCPVPAASARLTVTDQIFTRLGRAPLRLSTAPADQHTLNSANLCPLLLLPDITQGVFAGYYSVTPRKVRQPWHIADMAEA